MSKDVTREMAISKSITEGQAGFDLALSRLRDASVTYTDVASFGSKKLINQLVGAKWSVDFPEDFVVCHCTNETDYKNAQANNAYNWFIAMKNGKFDPSDSYQISDRTEWRWEVDYKEANPSASKDDIHAAWKKEFRSRLDKIIDEILGCDDIRVYAITHFSI